MSKYLNQVAQFHNTFKHPVLSTPQLAPADRAKLRVSLLQEELDELQEAIDKGDLVEVADALCDLQYVLSGTVLEFGMKNLFNTMFDEVHRSNMSKACKSYDVAIATQSYYAEKGTEAYHEEQADGTYLVLRKSDNKTLKSINYSPADLASFLKPHCPECMTSTPQEELDMFGGLCELCNEGIEIELADKNCDL
jgi:predicted HAD superfamily Cof-like phosphohydrolase